MREICKSHFSHEIELLETILGVKEDAAMRIVAEIGVGMKAFLIASAIVGWAGLKPINEESARKNQRKKNIARKQIFKSIAYSMRMGDL